MSFNTLIMTMIKF